MKLSPAISLLLVTGSFFLPAKAEAQDEWPRSYTGADSSVITLYKPQADSIMGDMLKFRSVYTLREKGSMLPQQGSFAALAVLKTDRNIRKVSFLSAKVLRLAFSPKTDATKMSVLKEDLERAIVHTGMDISMDEMVRSLCRVKEQYKLYVYGELNYGVPRIIVAMAPSVLVLTDGMPRLKWYRDWGVNVVENSPNTIAESGDGWYYLYGGGHWYIGPAAVGPYFHIDFAPPAMLKVQTAVDKANGTRHREISADGPGRIPEVIVSPRPAELIQTAGAPQFAAIPGTPLFYVSNSGNDIFLDSSQHLFYVLLSGRWYSSPALAGNWKFVAADSLPPDFAQIPENSVKANVLSGVAGTQAALEALVDARIPQTAYISRRTTDTVVYDGQPKFASIRGTTLQYAVNTPAIVLRQGSNYFCVDKGIWFSADRALGPWTVCTKRPEDVTRIPPDYPAYISKFVFIYDVGPDYVRAGFTPGYLNSFIDGPTLVYGTGFAYHSWQNKNYYPLPSTWGFNMQYSPLLGWCFGSGYGLDWFNPGIAWGRGFWTGGWWGPSVYRPHPYRSDRDHQGRTGYY